MTPCQIEFFVKRRNGKPKWWCTTHQCAAWDSQGERVAACAASQEPRVADEECPLEIRIDDYLGGVALWGALPAVYDTTGRARQRGVHVHTRVAAVGRKTHDRTVPAVRISGTQLLADFTVKEPDAVSYVVGSVLGLRLKTLSCPKCGHLHLDRDFFAVNPHIKHQCNGCGREFFDKEVGISNPLVLLGERLGSTTISAPTVRATGTLSCKQSDFEGGIQVWGSNSAVLWTALRPEQEGIHVHGYDDAGRRLVDETFAEVEIDDERLDARMVRYLMVQRALEHLSPLVVTAHCTGCGSPHFDHEQDFARRPHGVHLCETCGIEFTDPKHKFKSVSNPMLAVFERLATGARGS